MTESGLKQNAFILDEDEDILRGTTSIRLCNKDALCDRPSSVYAVTGISVLFY